MAIERERELTSSSFVSQTFRYLSPEEVVKIPVSCGNHWTTDTA